MKRQEMRLLAVECRDCLTDGNTEAALARLLPVVAARTPFPLLDLAGQTIVQAAATNATAVTTLLDGLAAMGEIGAWPLFGSALNAAYLASDLPRAFAEARRYILQASVWHATDAIAERVLGAGLCADFCRALAAEADGPQEATQVDGAQGDHLSPC